jgi:hypothetical protein
MNKVKKNPVRLINKYTKEEVYTRDYNDVTKDGLNEFIKVYNQSNPQRTYLVNRTAFVVAK